MKSTILVVLLFAAAAAYAQPPGPDTGDAKELKRIDAQATRHYNLGEFDRAITLYREAYRLSADPVFLYNVAQAYRLESDFQNALFFYKSFLRNMPKAPNRAQVEARIQEMEEQLERQRQTTEAPPQGTVPAGGQLEPTPPVSPPPAAEVAAASEAGQEAATPPTVPDAPHDRKQPIYKRWWFWAGVGAIAVATTAVVLMTTGDESPPSTAFGNRVVF